MHSGTCREVGRPGKERVFRLKADNEWDRSCPASPLIRSNHADRCLVGTTAPRFSRTRDVYRLLNLGCISGNPLLFWQLCLAFLFAGTFCPVPALLFRAKNSL